MYGLYAYIIWSLCYVISLRAPATCRGTPALCWGPFDPFPPRLAPPQTSWLAVLTCLSHLKRAPPGSGGRGGGSGAAGHWLGYLETSRLRCKQLLRAAAVAREAVAATTWPASPSKCRRAAEPERNGLSKGFLSASFCLGDARWGEGSRGALSGGTD